MSVFCRGRLEQYSDSLFQFLNECAQSAHFVKNIDPQKQPTKQPATYILYMYNSINSPFNAN